MTAVVQPAAEAARFPGAPDAHPAARFAHPDDVLSHPALTRAEKRAILSAWASDACAVAAAPALRRAPGASHAVPVAQILSALVRLDTAAPATAPRRGWHSPRTASARAARLPLPARPTRRYLERHVFRAPPEMAALHAGG